MKLRAITGFFFILVMLASVWCGSITFSVFYLILSVLCLYEFYGLVKQNSIHPNIYIGLINGALLFGSIALHYYYTSFIFFLLAVPLLLASTFIQELYKKAAAPFTNIAFMFLGILFAVVPFIFFHGLGFILGSFNYHLPLGFLLMLWANDTGAYLVGSKIGRVRLFERHSPKKSWEGFIGGIIITAIVAYILSNYYTELNWKQWVSVGILISCFGTLGDLVESMFKRSINVKDSGGLLPGHGGLLDRFDGLLLAAPIVYAYVYFVTNS